MQMAHPFRKTGVRDPLADALHGAVGPIPPPSSRPEAACPSQPQILAVTGSTNEPLHRILQWIRYHQVIGFSVFYLFVEGSASDPAVVDVLRSLVGVKVRLPDVPSRGAPDLARQCFVHTHSNAAETEEHVRGSAGVHAGREAQVVAPAQPCAP